MGDELLTTAETMRLLRVSNGTLIRLRKAAKLTGVRHDPSNLKTRLYYRTSEVRALAGLPATPPASEAPPEARPPLTDQPVHVLPQPPHQYPPGREAILAVHRMDEWSEKLSQCSDREVDAGINLLEAEAPRSHLLPLLRNYRMLRMADGEYEAA